jgi:hypothetical protein
MMFYGRAQKVLNTLPALMATAMFALCEAAPAQAAASLVVSYPSGFTSTSGNINVSASAAMSGSTIQLTPGTQPHEAGGAWYTTPVNIQSFTTNFTFQLPPNGAVPSIQGITFCIQNANATTNPNFGGLPTHASSDANLVGYGAYSNQQPIGNSVAVKFDLNPYDQLGYPSGGHPNSTGLYIDGGPLGALLSEDDLNPYGIDLYSGHVFSGTIVYDGTLLTMTILDTSSNAQARYVWPINIPAITGSNTAYVGFTGGEVNTAQENLLSWSFSSGINTRLATPTFGVTPGSYTSEQSVTIAGPAGSKIYYTTNGLLPTSSSTLYSGPVTVGASEVIQAVAIESGNTDSLVAAGNYQIAASGSPLINFPSGFAGASNLVKTVGYSSISGSSIQLTDTKNLFEVGAAWFPVPVNVQTFSTSFGLDFSSSNSNGSYGLGTTFTIQNQPTTTSTAPYGFVSGGPMTLGNDASSLGYGYMSPGTLTGTTGGILDSVAVKFDLSDNATGLYTAGALPTSPDVAITGVTLSSGHLLNTTLAYDGTTLTLTIKDSVTGGTFTHAWTVNIPTTVGGNTAYVGFTGSSGYFSANQDIQSWTFGTTTTTSSTPPPAATVPDPPSNVTVQ